LTINHLYCCILLVFFLHALLTMHGHRNIKQNSRLLFFAVFPIYLKKSVFLLFQNILKVLEFLSTGLGSCMCFVYVVTGLVCSLAISITWGHRRIFQIILSNIEFYLFRVLNAGLMDKFSELPNVHVVSLRRNKVFFISLMAGTLTVYHWPVRKIKIKS